MKPWCLEATVLMMMLLLSTHLHQLECRVLVSSSAAAINGDSESSEISAEKASISSKFQSSSRNGKAHKHRGNQGMFTLASGPYGKGIGHK
nr:hypothetical protein Iba_chr05cCG4930 [Ipomoea batatas]GMC97083.1 hypothetical protein Iba_chr05dCG3690 [Ipomoea batatas]GMD00934.1 hypothetical protein Iba_chr05fCG2620 [Ipomoea batatas]GMD82495.1 hypothetical protein Iba_scaffold1580827CG0010 [Ipomoea batatas]